jgi:antibiotic biosynthesis monooxygenase (ABM) superfamily enzyme
VIQNVKLVWRTKRRQILIAWLAAWPTLTLVLFALQPFSRDWPLPLRSLASATAMVLIMNFFSVPTVRASRAKSETDFRGTYALF